MTSPHAEPRLADVVELPLTRMAPQGEPASGGDEREPETIILLW